MCGLMSACVDRFAHSGSGSRKRGETLPGRWRSKLEDAKDVVVEEAIETQAVGIWGHSWKHVSVETLQSAFEETLTFLVPVPLLQVVDQGDMECLSSITRLDLMPAGVIVGSKVDILSRLSVEPGRPNSVMFAMVVVVVVCVLVHALLSNLRAHGRSLIGLWSCILIQVWVKTDRWVDTNCLHSLPQLSVTLHAVLPPVILAVS